MDAAYATVEGGLADAAGEQGAGAAASGVQRQQGEQGQASAEETHDEL